MRLIDPQLQAFLAIVKHKTVHAAALSLHITQTAVTQRIRTLENKLSTSLFVRSRRGMLLTIEGEALLRYCQEVQELEGETLSSITKMGKEKNAFICMSGPSTIMHARLIPECIPVMQIFPRLLIQFDVNDNNEGTEKLRRGECQFAIVEPNAIYDEMAHKILKPEHYVLVCTSKWKKRKLQDIIKNEKIIDFNVEDNMTFNYLSHYGLLKWANKERYFVNRTDSLAFMLTQEVGYGVLPVEFAKPYIEKKQLIMLNNGKFYPYLLALAWFPRHQPPAYFQALIEACR